MKNYMVTLVFLLFDVNLNFGHTLPKIELKNEREIYEVKEDRSALLITHPKDDATKLREIIYYHIIEKPYEVKDLSHDKIKSDFEKRRFTNSHSGIQFEKKDRDDNSDEDEMTSDELDDDLLNSSEETNDDSNSNDSSEEKDDELSLDKNKVSKDAINDKDKSSSNKNGDNDSIKTDKSDVDDNKKSAIDPDSIQIDIRFSDFITNTTEGVAKVESTSTNVTADPETKNEAISETPQSRSKREINHTETGQAMNAKTREGLNFEDGLTPKREEGTYGMSLTGNRGAVWNDVKPTHIEYYVGESEALATSKPDVAEVITTTESAKEAVDIQATDDDNQGNDDGEDEEEYIETLSEIEKILDNLIDQIQIKNKSEYNQVIKNDGNPEIRRDDNEHDNDDLSLDPIEIEKSFIEIIKVFKELAGDDTSNATVTDFNDATKPANDVVISEDNNSGESSTESLLRALKQDDDDGNDESVNLGTKLAPKRNDKDKETSNKDNDRKQQQFVKELVKNKYFWAWLKDTSAAYLEILMKKLDTVIKTEVGKQIEQYFEEHKIENCKQEQNDAELVQEPVQTGNVTEDNVNDNTTNTPSSTNDSGLASNNNTAELINKSNETSSEVSNKKHKDKPSADKDAETPVKIEAQNLFGSSIGSGKVTNIFIYNINKASDLDNIKPIKNGTDGIFVFGLDNKKPEQDKDDSSDKDSIPEIETIKPDISSEDNKTLDKITDTDVNQTSTAKPEAEKDQQSFEKDKIKDKDQVKDKDNVEHDTNKSEGVPNDQTVTQANDSDVSTEITKEESIASTETPLDVIKDDKVKDDIVPEKVAAKEDPNDTEVDTSNRNAEAEVNQS